MNGEGREEIRPLPPEFHDVHDTWAPENEEFPMPGTYRSLAGDGDGDDDPAPRRTRSAFQVLAALLLCAVFLMGALPAGTDFFAPAQEGAPVPVTGDAGDVDLEILSAYRSGDSVFYTYVFRLNAADYPVSIYAQVTDAAGKTVSPPGDPDVWDGSRSVFEYEIGVEGLGDGLTLSLRAVFQRDGEEKAVVAVSPVADEPPEDTAAYGDNEPEPTPEPIDVRATLVSYGTWGTTGGDYLHFDEDGTGWCFDGEYFGLLTFEGDAESVSFRVVVTTRGEHLESIPGKPGAAPDEEWSGVVFTATATITREELTHADPYELFTADPYLDGSWDHFVPAEIAADLSVLESVRGKTAEELLTGSWGIQESYLPTTTAFGVPFVDIIVFEGNGEVSFHCVDTLEIGDEVFTLSGICPDETVPAMTIDASEDLAYMMVFPDSTYQSYTEIGYSAEAVLLIRESGVTVVLWTPFGVGLAEYFHYED